MSDRIESFFIDRNYRRVIYTLGSLVSALYASMNLMVLHRAKATVSFETAILSFLFLIVSILLHSALRKNPQTNDAPIFEVAHLSPTFIVLAIAIIFVFAIAQSNLLVKIQAAVLEARIENVRNPVGSARSSLTLEQRLVKVKERSRKLASIEDTSKLYKIPVDVTRLKLAEQDLQATEGHLQGEIATDATVGNTKPVPPSGYVINTVLDLTNQKVRFTGNNASLILGDSIVIKDSTVVFDGINLRAEQPYFEGLYVGSGSSVVVQNGTVENLIQTLDRVTWINVEFRHSMIKVGGASYSLVNVTFRDCDLRWLEGPSGQAGTILLEKIREANSGPITFTFDKFASPPKDLSIRNE